MFYILFIMIIIIIAGLALLYKYQYNTREPFLTNRITLTNDTLRPLVIGILRMYPIQREVVGVLSKYIPLYWYLMHHSLEYLQPELIEKTDLVVMFRPTAVNLYLSDKLPDLRFITNLYTLYLSLCVDNDSPLNEYDDIMYVLKHPTNSLHFYIMDESIEHSLRILFQSDEIIFNVIQSTDLNKKMDLYGIYVLWTTEYSQPLTMLSTHNKYRIITFKSDQPILQKIQKKYPAIRITKYDISLQHASNVERVIYSLHTKMAIYSVRNSSDDRRIYTFIQTYFDFLEKIRTEVKTPEAKHTLEDIRIENLIEIALVPYHDQVYNYFRKLQLITRESDSICKNVIASIPCNPKILYDNRMKLMFAPYEQSNIFVPKA